MEESIAYYCFGRFRKFRAKPLVEMITAPLVMPEIILQRLITFAIVCRYGITFGLARW